MTQEEYFGDWYPYIDAKSMDVALSYVSRERDFYPHAGNVFKAFTMCPARATVAVFLGQDPYPQKDIATGIAFGNKADTPEDRLSPSLAVIKESVIDYARPHHVLAFDNTLESWARQGILMLNCSLTVKPYVPSSHYLYWKPFITGFLERFSRGNGGIAYVLFGKQAQSFRDCISPVAGKIFEVEHPAALARRHGLLPGTLFRDVGDYVHGVTARNIEWYHEEDYGEFTL